eukprot:55210_1
MLLNCVKESFCKPGTFLQVTDNTIVKVIKRESLWNSVIPVDSRIFPDDNLVFGSYEINPHKYPHQILQWKLDLTKLNGPIYIGVKKPEQWNSYKGIQRKYCWSLNSRHINKPCVVTIQINTFYGTIMFTGIWSNCGFIDKSKSYHLTIGMKGKGTEIHLLEFSKTVENATGRKEALHLFHGQCLNGTDRILNSPSTASVDISKGMLEWNWENTKSWEKALHVVVYGDYIINMRKRQNKILRWKFQIVKCDGGIMIGIDSSNRMHDDENYRKGCYECILYGFKSGGYKVSNVTKYNEGGLNRLNYSRYGDVFYAGYIVTMELNTKHRELIYYLNTAEYVKVPKNMSMSDNVRMPEKLKCLGVAFSNIQNIEYNLVIYLSGDQNRQSTVKLLDFEEMDLNEIEEKKESESIINNVQLMRANKQMTKDNELYTVIEDLRRRYNVLYKQYELSQKLLVKKDQQNKKLRNSLKALQVKYEKLKRFNQQQSMNFEEWNSKQVLNWILSLKNGAFMVYQNVLTKFIEKEQIEGIDLINLNKTDLDRIGILELAQNYLLNQIQILSGINRGKNVMDEIEMSNEGGVTDNNYTNQVADHGRKIIVHSNNSTINPFPFQIGNDLKHLNDQIYIKLISSIKSYFHLSIDCSLRLYEKINGSKIEINDIIDLIDAFEADGNNNYVLDVYFEIKIYKNEYCGDGDDIITNL